MEYEKQIKYIFSIAKGNADELSQLIDRYLIPQELDKKQNAEVSTPYSLRQDMLNAMPSEFWTQKHTVFEPCAGKGGFLIDIVHRFKEGLKPLYTDDEELYRVIVEECLYFSDINATNIFICRLLLDPYGKYKLNYNEGDTLKLDIKEKWNLEGFDAVIGNPPYNSPRIDKATGNTIWNKFVHLAIDDWLYSNGYLSYVHPNGWRKPNTEKGKFYGLFNKMTTNNSMLYLEIHDVKSGMSQFNCGTRYDWYLIMKKQNIDYKTTILDQNKVIHKINLSKHTWLGNYDLELIANLIANDTDDKCNILQSMSAYEARKKWISKNASDEFKYPVIHSTPKDGTRFIWSNRNDNGFYGISKVIFGDSGIYNPIIDMDGKYAMTQHAMAIQVDNITEATNICNAITTNKFNNILKACLWSSYAIEWSMFRDFKKDFYNYI